MSPIALGLDLLLAGLLTAALMLGAKLNVKLKALRESHAGFAKAVGELDVAGRRAEAALASIRVASEETHDDLLKRIETARSLSTKLERATIEAQRALEERAHEERAFLERASRERASLERASLERARAEAERPVSLAALARRPRDARPQPSNDRDTPATPERKPLRSIFDEDILGNRERERPRLFGGRRR